MRLSCATSSSICTLQYKYYSDTPKRHLDQQSLSLLNKVRACPFLLPLFLFGNYGYQVCTADPDSFHNLSKYLKGQNGIFHEDFRCTLLRRRVSGKPHDKAFWSLSLGRKAIVGGSKASSGRLNMIFYVRTSYSIQMTGGLVSRWYRASSDVA